ncbi:hypothetical protein FVE85_5771 [Porphyridium purpureum]|uniref:Uncharacterized protein n=1 Tax=Porphyridium purpureum TaxID=35688 RepID=A0A5J4Z3J8_PORPP|nr:hypothetical protein FVE85_5771 [Porphyridium purpureum]|eukprot:POR9002..scf295_1
MGMPSNGRPCLLFPSDTIWPEMFANCEENFEILATSSTMTRGGATIVPAMTRGVVTNGGAKVTTGTRSGPPRARAVRASAHLGPGARGRDIKEVPVSLSWCLSRLGGRDESVLRYKGGFGIRKSSSLGKATTCTMAFVYAHAPIHNPGSHKLIVA